MNHFHELNCAGSNLRHVLSVVVLRDPALRYTNLGQAPFDHGTPFDNSGRTARHHPRPGHTRGPACLPRAPLEVACAAGAWAGSCDHCRDHCSLLCAARPRLAATAQQAAGAL